MKDVEFSIEIGREWCEGTVTGCGRNMDEAMSNAIEEVQRMTYDLPFSFEFELDPEDDPFVELEFEYIDDIDDFDIDFEEDCGIFFNQKDKLLITFHEHSECGIEYTTYYFDKYDAIKEFDGGFFEHNYLTNKNIIDFVKFALNGIERYGIENWKMEDFGFSFDYESYEEIEEMIDDECTFRDFDERIQ